MVERHYDSLLLLYRAFWGEHIHHGLWSHGDEPPAAAQERLVAHLADRAEIRDSDRVLDVGCGYGASARWLARQRGCPVTGITISRGQARLARRLALRQGLLPGAVALVRGDAAALPFDARSFDVIWVIECIEHLANKPAFIRDAERLLRPGGRLALCSWQRGAGIPASEPLVRQVCEAFLCPSLASASEYVSYCEEAGLRVMERDDLTEGVRRTWKILMQRVGRPWLAPVRLLVGSGTRRFVDGFAVIDRAYEAGKMSYGLLVASKAQGKPRRRPS